METATFYCDHCGAVVHVAATNHSARTRAYCYGQQEVATITNGVEDPLHGNHESKEMRMIGTLPIERKIDWRAS